ncbi:hypothetical protein KK141_16570 [Dyella sp. LX-66]|uniref:hypothetical protein n=1 Tax=unclassified Dyella TaxID=2634549 RepID=UPI001BDF866A|nr:MULTISPECIES: hypothetical protein [unclassified Dyella]MBT2118811.1 hypothetical protein [Dyella sp. LX-1]MBT2141160.1 hypothetical protein [Dyella sp. LX-66]
MTAIVRPFRSGGITLIILLAATLAIYWPGLRGGWLFDDYPNIVDNHGVQPSNASLASLVQAALSSPASDFKRPLASLSFAANYLATGLNPYWMKLANLAIHLLNGLLVFVLARQLIIATSRADSDLDSHRRAGVAAAWIAGGWLLLPINLTSVLYVVQRMESMANLFVLVGLIGYIAGRRHMLAGSYGRGLILSAASIAVPAAIGLLAKETAVMLPLYAACVEWVVFRFQRSDGRRDAWIAGGFLLFLALPLVAGLAWLLPGLLKPSSWATRDFTLATRLFSEARIVPSYVVWTVLPTPNALSFYHDNFRISTDLLSPWTTTAGIASLAVLIFLALRLRTSRPLIALGLQFFIGCHLLTGTILPLELIYEHRNYFASFGLMLAIVPALIDRTQGAPERMLWIRRTLFGVLLLLWASLTAMTSLAWSSPLQLAEELAARAPDSPRAQYELGRTYIIYSNYDPASPFTQMAYAPLERAAALPESSILPEQALIFMNSRMRLPLKDSWWETMTSKLKARTPTVQDESSLGALVQCARSGQCDLPRQRMVGAFLAALSHTRTGSRTLATYGDYAWNVLDDKNLGLRMATEALRASPNEPAYHITVIRMLIAQGKLDEARLAIKNLEALNYGGRLDSSIAELRARMPSP